MSTRAVRLVAFLVLVGLSAFSSLLSGCCSFKKTWKATKDLYYEYMEPRPHINLGVVELGDTEEYQLARLFTPVDERIYTLCKFLDGEDRLPTQDWFRTLFDRFPWINGAMFVDIRGEVQFQYPSDFSNSVNINALLVLGKRPASGGKISQSFTTACDMGTGLIVGQEETQMTTLNVTNSNSGGNHRLVDATNKASKLGKIDQKELQCKENLPLYDHKMYAMSSNFIPNPGIYLAQPLFDRNEWSGLVIVHFSLYNLLECCCPEPDRLVVLSLDQVLWAGKYQKEAAALMRESWRQILARRVVGRWSQGREIFYWFGRQLANYHLVYAVAVKEINSQTGFQGR